IFKQCLRIAAREQITLAPPAAHPFNPLLGLRIASLRSLSLADRTRLINTLFDATWGAAGDGIDSADKVRAALDGAGMASDELIEAATTDDSKRRLTETTNAAVRSGVFGVPTMELDGELFWGYDALPDLELFARGEDPVRVADLERWRDLPVGASRR
ncbi:MAG: DsbA family protein, partial [Myxococcota bacterium]